MSRRFGKRGGGARIARREVISAASLNLFGVISIKFYWTQVRSLSTLVTMWLKLWRLECWTLVKSDANCLMMSQQLKKTGKSSRSSNHLSNLPNQRYLMKTIKLNLPNKAKFNFELLIELKHSQQQKNINLWVCCAVGNDLLVRPIAVRLERKKCLLSWSFAEPFLTWIFWTDEES